MNSKLRVPIGMLLTASVLLVGGLGCSQDKEQEEAAAVTARQTTNVELAVAKRGEIMQRTSLVGHVQALEKAEVFTRVAGRVTNVYVREGDSVHKGQILIQLDDTVQRNKVAEEKAALSRAQASLIQAQAAYNAALTRVEQAQENVGVTDVSSSLEVQRAKQGVIQAESALNTAQANYDDALLNMRRQQDLFAKDAVSSYTREQAELREHTAKEQLKTATSALASAKESLRLAQNAQRQVNILGGDVKASQAAAEQAKASIAQAKASVESASAAYNSALTDLNDMAIKAPINGTVTKRNVEIGTSISSSGGASLISIVDNSRLEMISPLDEKFAPYVQPGMHLNVETSMSQDTPADIIDVIPASDPSSHSVKVRLSIRNENGKLLDGAYAKADMPVQNLKGVLVPRTAVNSSVGEVFAVVFEGSGDDGKAKKVPITLLYTDGVNAIVTGVQIGDKVVTSGALDIVDGQDLHIAATETGNTGNAQAETEENGTK
ncbi:MAG: efflux RND transporter periplasmic adaptor subunit [bacterium]|nr:efflux RND transporter periplasmic adaptor subunit [bacterium]